MILQHEALYPVRGFFIWGNCGERRVKAMRNHGKTHTRLYRIWKYMKRRCYNENAKVYRDYGGRGISICDEWLSDFMAFYEWSVANGYEENLTIDRINNNGNYAPSNCRWVLQSKNNLNKRNSRYLEYKGEIKTAIEWSEIKGFHYRAFLDRIYRGWSVEKAIETPFRKK